MAMPRFAEMARPRHMYEEDFAAAAPEITPPRRPPFKFSLRTIGTLSIIVCAAALIAGAGTLLFFRNDKSSLAWFAQPQQSTKTEVAIQSSASKAGSLMPATVEPRVVMSKVTGSTTKSRGACGARKAWTRIVDCRNCIPSAPDEK